MRSVLIVLVFVVAPSGMVSVAAASTIFGTVVVSATATIVAAPQPEDLDGDGCVGSRDLYLVVRNLGLAAPSPQEADINNDGRVDILDATSVALLFGIRSFGSGRCP